MLNLYDKVFYVLGKVPSGELSHTLTDLVFNLQLIYGFEETGICDKELYKAAEKMPADKPNL